MTAYLVRNAASGPGVNFNLSELDGPGPIPVQELGTKRPIRVTDPLYERDTAIMEAFVRTDAGFSIGSVSVWHSRESFSDFRASARHDGVQVYVAAACQSHVAVRYINAISGGHAYAEAGRGFDHVESLEGKTEEDKAAARDAASALAGRLYSLVCDEVK